MNIRPFNYVNGDYESAIAVENAINPDNPSSVEGWQHWDQNREEKYLFRRYLAEKEGQVIAVGAIGHTGWSYHPDKYFLDISVHPQEQGQGIGRAFYRFLVDELEALAPTKLVAFTRENRTRAIRFLEERGFAAVMRMPVSRLDPTTFDAGRFARRLAGVEEAGIVVKSLRELSEEDPEWKRKVYELEWECAQDVPSPDPLTKQPFAVFEKRSLGSPSLLPDAWFVAVDGDCYVGLSVLWRNLADDKLLGTGLTGVVRSHRRLGIATAMKVRAIQYAQAHGITAIDTDNEENNPMFQLNLQLGFVPQPAHLHYEKEVLQEAT